MRTFPNGTKSVLARCISAEVRGRLAAMRISGRAFAIKTGFSQNYLAMRLRDEAPFTLDDLEVITREFDDEPEKFVATAVASHEERIYGDQESELVQYWAAAVSAEARGDVSKAERLLGALLSNDEIDFVIHRDALRRVQLEAQWNRDFGSTPDAFDDDLDAAARNEDRERPRMGDD